MSCISKVLVDVRWYLISGCYCSYNRIQECFFNTTTGECTPVDAATALYVTKASRPLIQTDPISLSLLVMILEYPACGLYASLTEDIVRTLYLGPLQDGGGGEALKYRQCSYGRFTLNTTTFRAMRVPHDCNSLITTCSFWAISSLADAAARVQITSSSFISYTHYTYILPPAMAGKCSWAGLASLPGRQTWLQSTLYGLRWATIMQESLHNFGA